MNALYIIIIIIYVFEVTPNIDSMNRMELDMKLIDCQ